MPVVAVKGNEEHDKLPTALTAFKHMRSYTELLLPSICHSVPLMKLGHRVEAADGGVDNAPTSLQLCLRGRHVETGGNVLQGPL